MPAFQSCVEKGRVTGLMCSLNALNGVPACANNWLLKETARENWGFEGYVSTDCTWALIIVVCTPLTACANTLYLRSQATAIRRATSSTTTPSRSARSKGPRT